MALYSLQNVTQVYNGRCVLHVPELEINRGEILGLLGPSGAGKSTLLRLLAFLESPTNGIVSYNNEEMIRFEQRRQVSLVWQKPLLLRRTVWDNVAYSLHIRGEKHQLAARVTAVLAQFGLSHLANVPAQSLSGGEVQRVALARALIFRPQVLLLDEPTANLDPANVRLLEGMIAQSNRQEGTTIVLVTHQLFQAKRLAHQVGVLWEGKLLEVADTASLFTSPQNPQTAAFLRGDLIY